MDVFLHCQKLLSNATMKIKDTRPRVLTCPDMIKQVMVEGVRSLRALNSGWP